MGTNACIFAVWVEDTALVAAVNRRIESLRRFYGQEPGALARQAPAVDGHVLISTLHWPSDERDPGVQANRSVRTWGEPLPAGLRRAEELITASDDDLRDYEGAGACFGASDERVRIINGAGGPTSLYTCSGKGVTVWSTHAVAAAWLAREQVDLDFERLPELLAFDFVGGSGTIVRGVSAVSPGTSVEIDATGVTERYYAPSPWRWAPVPARHAQSACEQALVRSMRRRLSSNPAPGLALTGGLDSQVVALAIAEAGCPMRAFTWGAAEWPDSAGARKMAAQLGVEHRAYPGERLSETEARSQLQEQAIFADGIAALSFGSRTWPSGVSRFVIGMGGETGRAFYYEADAALRRWPSRGQLLDALAIAGRLRGASPDARALAREGAARWIECARASGRHGWSLLDVAYAEQRVAHWGRSQYVPLASPIVPAFTSAYVTRALASLPLSERLASGFHRRFLADRGHDRPAPRSSLGWRLTPRPVRRALVKFRYTHVEAEDQVDEFLAQSWRERPSLRNWVADDVLRRPELVRVMGESWANSVRAGFLEGRRHAVERAQLAAGPFTLVDELRRLSRQ
jgi:hypothetical protein